MTRFNTLSDWLAWQETLHPRTIDLGLDRVAAVARKLDCLQPAPVVVTVAGTNGKGSTLAMLEAVLRRAGYRTGCYTSPHLLHYNERLRIDGEVVADHRWCDAFAHIDRQRGETSLTYFEFGTLAALDIMQRGSLDVALLEVGLGGRLDAVNIVDADVAIVTSIGLDHTDWLGDTREAIGLEKAGIFRAGRPAICGDAFPPDSLLEKAVEVAADLQVIGRDFRLRHSGKRWHWQGRDSHYQDLPWPALPGAHQLANAATALAALETLNDRLPVTESAVVGGLKWVALPGRVQVLPGKVEQVLDVAHNAQAALALVDALRHRPLSGATHAVIGMMRDKDIDAFVEALRGQVDHWYPVGLDVDRALSPQQFTAHLQQTHADGPVTICPSVAEALEALAGQVQTGDRILVCGSFYTVAEWSALDTNFD
ncbi:dihydrofolate synthase/folylpolyglutamate synthase [Thiogranum longum]|uniref:Dihydrofolate synthase/folylpolyglutamate synthase n=1 Tax=Thiogranum longum TaxID=1537524 RepID=A0A4R1HEL1_9GAMM|nr:bifunctional tetrahydrofolate synthase/dihydrofolate synthase [Thiogranum longum]TCK17779.1 dihydrofolate synthase/folylpolyglutamate synthase [Thiogranum longum]